MTQPGKFHTHQDAICFVTLKSINAYHSNTSKNIIKKIILSMKALIAAHQETTAITINQQVGGK